MSRTSTASLVPPAGKTAMRTPIRWTSRRSSRVACPARGPGKRQLLSGREADHDVVEISLDLGEDMLEKRPALNGKERLASSHAPASPPGQNDEAHRLSGAQNGTAFRFCLRERHGIFSVRFHPKAKRPAPQEASGSSAESRTVIDVHKAPRIENRYAL